MLFISHRWRCHHFELKVAYVLPHPNTLLYLYGYPKFFFRVVLLTLQQVVDNTITEDCNWDFFLQSHTALQGTARPAHYFVLLDEIFRSTFPGDAVAKLETLTYNMCYLFGRATTSVSIPPPVLYADLACERARRYHTKHFDPDQENAPREPDPADMLIHDDLKDTMFYI